MSKINNYQKPFLKWVGGKTQIINDIVNTIPTQIQNYHEIFLGGGSVLLAVLSLQKQGKITITGNVCAYDLNEQLINVYKNVQKNKDELFIKITEYVNTYSKISGTEINRDPNTLEQAITSRESYYYWLRKKYNEIIDKTSVDCSALFMVINKTCFRGMYREGPRGYNVPFGHYKTVPTVITRQEIDNVSELIKNVNFVHSDFQVSMENVGEGDIMYLDPPYAPETCNSFVKYTSDGFGLDKHNALFTLIKELHTKKNVSFIMSNAKVSLVTDAFCDYNCQDIVARRAIHSKNPGETTIEIVVSGLL